MAQQKTWSRRPLDPAEAVALMRRHGLEPLTAYTNAKSPWPSLCIATGKETSPRLDKVKRQNKHVCLWCMPNAAVDPDEARKAMLARDLEPLEPYPGRNDRPWLCRCLRCGSEVTPLYAHVQQGGARSCPTCKSATCRDLRLSETDPERAVEEMLAAGFETLEPFHGTNAPWKCRCTKCGALRQPRLNNIRQRGDGCADCTARGGFKTNFPALVYLIHHEAHKAIKVGIGKAGAYRLDHHRVHGWVVLAIEHVPGARAPEIEREILRWWRVDLGLPPYLSKHEMPQRGWTETVDADAIDIPSTKARIRALAAA